MSAKEKGVDLKAAALGHRDGNVIVVNSEIQDPSEMKGKTFAIQAEQVAKDRKIKKYAAIRYESANSKFAVVNSKGMIRAKSKGTCYIYVYAQNGVYKRIKVTVK